MTTTRELLEWTENYLIKLSKTAQKYLLITRQFSSQNLPNFWADFQYKKDWSNYSWKNQTRILIRNSKQNSQHLKWDKSSDK